MSEADRAGNCIAIRPFEISDYDAVLALWRSGAPGIELRSSDSRAKVAKKCQRDRELFLVSLLDECIVGVVMGGWDGRRGWIHHLAVSPQARGQGIARALVCDLEECLACVGGLKGNLLVRQENSAARSLYTALGYSESPSLLVMGK